MGYSCSSANNHLNSPHLLNSLDNKIKNDKDISNKLSEDFTMNIECNDEFW